MDYLGKNIPKLGFGLMRLPMLGEKVDIEQTKTMVDHFLAAGFNYFDTAYGYLGGKSEAAAKVALVDRYPRDKFYLATKLPAFAANNAEEARQMFYTSLERTGAGYFDFYLLHNLGDNRTEKYEEYGIWDFVKEQKEKGLIRHIGFSMHDKADALDKVLTQHPEAEFVQLQINYADWESDSVQSRKCYEVARKHGKSVIIMEPVKGGSLANLPDSVADVFHQADADASMSSWALRFAANRLGGTVLRVYHLVSLWGVTPALLTVAVLVAAWFRARRLYVTTYRLSTEKPLPGGHLRVVQLSDLHPNPRAALHRGRIPELREKLAALHADMLVFTGDVFDEFTPREEFDIFFCGTGGPAGQVFRVWQP